MPRGRPPTHWVAPDLGSVAWAVRIAQEKFLTGDASAAATVRSMVVDSWRRKAPKRVLKAHEHELPGAEPAGA